MDGIQEAPATDEEQDEKKMMKIEYRGKVTDKFETSLKRINVPCVVIKILEQSLYIFQNDQANQQYRHWHTRTR